MQFRDDVITGVFPESRLVMALHNAIGKLSASDMQFQRKRLMNGAWITHYRHPTSDKLVLFIHGRGLPRDSFTNVHRYHLLDASVISLDVRNLRTCHIDIHDAVTYMNQGSGKAIIIANSLGVFMMARYLKSRESPLEMPIMLCAGPSTLAAAIASYPLTPWFLRKHAAAFLRYINVEDVELGEVLHQCNGSVTLIHGTDDRVIPVKHLDRIINTRTKKKCVCVIRVQNAGHSELVTREEFKTAMQMSFHS